MLNESKEKTIENEAKEIDDLLMKPFTLGWRREVVRRLITKNRSPNCDIYYFSPNGKKIRSLPEIKGNLPEHLTADCFSFKKEPLGVGDSYETIRDAKVKVTRKADRKSVEKKKFSKEPKKPKKLENTDVGNDTKENKRKNSETKEGSKNSKNEADEGQREDVSAKKEMENIRPRRTKVKKTLDSKENDRTLKSSRPSISSVRKRKEVLKKAIRAKQAKIVAGKKILKKVVRKKVITSPKRKLSKMKTGIDVQRKSKISELIKNSMKSKIENAKNEVNREGSKKSGNSDLKSIVRKNIGKYREMREKQKLGTSSSQSRSQNRKIVVKKRSRSEPIYKNRFYLKPLEKGWRREVVFRRNCTRTSQMADVYYFHPNGKKFRSSREIAMNLTPDLPLECFTFRKEPIGCGEPSEVIRDARPSHKNQTVN